MINGSGTQTCIGVFDIAIVIASNFVQIFSLINILFHLLQYYRFHFFPSFFGQRAHNIKAIGIPTVRQLL